MPQECEQASQHILILHHVLGAVVPSDKYSIASFQDDLYKPNYYQGLMEFRAQTLARLQKFTAQRFFRTQDYLDGVHLAPA